MKFKLDHFIPFIIIGILVFLFVFNNKTPLTSTNNNVIVQPEHKVELVRTLAISDSAENDNHVTITHKASGDKLDFLEYKGYLLLPDGQKSLPTKLNSQGKEEQVFEIKHIKRDFIFDFNLDLGVYAGVVEGDFENQKTKNFDVGLRISPVRIYNTLASDILISNQDVGIGLSFYPNVIKYPFFDHLGLGIGRVITYEKSEWHNIAYLSFSTKF